MIIERIKKIALDNPNRIASKVDDDFITYKELIRKVEINSELLRKQGTSPVIIYGSKSIDTFVTIVSCLFAKRAYVPINLSTPTCRVEKIIEYVKSGLVITDQKINIRNIECIQLNELKKYESFKIRETENKVAYFIFTSGSTGEPKGVPISYDNLDNFAGWISSLESLSSYKKINVLNQADFSFDLSVADIYYSICNGHTLIALDIDVQTEYDKIFDILKNEEIDLMVVTPTFIKLCLINNEFNSVKLPHLKCIYFCGEQLEKKTVRNLFASFQNLKIINAYGPTEATSAISAIEIKPDYIDKYELLPVGDMNSLATDVEIICNEVILKGKSVFSGYLNNISGGYYLENGINCYKTGDIGYIFDNKLFIKGRADNQVKYKGYRIELSDIENNLNKIEGVEESLVLPLKNQEGVIKSLKAYVVISKPVDDLKSKLSLLIPKYMIPANIVIVDRLPINRNIKVDRKAVIS